MATRVRVLYFISVIRLVFLYSVASGENCPVNPDCSCSPGSYVNCDPKCGPSVPKFAATGQDLNHVNIFGNRDIKQILPGTFQNLSVTTLTIEYTGISDIDCDAFKGIDTSLQTLYVRNNYLESVPRCSLQHVKGITELQFADNKISNLTSDAFTNVPDLQTLNLERNEIETIEKGTFNTLNNLTYLDLRQNKLNSLQDGSIFEGLSSLKSLSLGNNKIKSIHPKTFDRLESLTNLKIDRNEISVLDGTTFDHLVNIEELNLAYNTILSLPENIFANLVKLVGLQLEGNHLISLPGTIFETTPSLGNLNIQGNNLSAISHRLFSSTPNLGTLDISGNRIVDIDPETFKGLKLTTVNIDNNLLTAVNSGVFKDCNQLGDISMKSNRIKDLQPGSFRNLSSLSWLDLSENYLTEIRAGVFDNSTRLYSLNLADNRISFIENGSLESQQESLRILNLRSNKLSQEAWVTLTPILTNLNKLTDLDLSNNRIGNLPTPVTGSLKNITELKLGNCSLTYFPFITTDFNSLDISSNNLKNNHAALSNFSSSLDVSGNNFQSVSFRISSNRFNNSITSINAEHNEINNVEIIHNSMYLDIYEFDLSNNLISTSPWMKTYKSGLRNITIYSLDLSSNKFNNVTSYPIRFNSSVAINPGLYRYVRINRLDLSHNNISFVSPEAFLGMITNLNLSHNRIQVLGRLLPANASSTDFKTEYLDLSGNFIHRIMSDVFYDHEKIIKNINLAQNSLTEIESLRNVLEEESFTRLYISDNPLNCDCESFWLRQESVASKLDSARCDTPDNAKGYMSLCYPLENCSGNQTLYIPASIMDLCKNDIQIRVDNLQFATLETVGNSFRVNVTWTRHGHGQITGYRLGTSGDSENLSLVHPAARNFIPYGLQLKTAYNICISAQREQVTVSEPVCKSLLVEGTDDYTVTISKSTLIGISSALGLCVLCVVLLLLCYFIRLQKGRFEGGQKQTNSSTTQNSNSGVTNPANDSNPLNTYEAHPNVIDNGINSETYELQTGGFEGSQKQTNSCTTQNSKSGVTNPANDSNPQNTYEDLSNVIDNGINSETYELQTGRFKGSQKQTNSSTTQNSNSGVTNPANDSNPKNTYEDPSNVIDNGINSETDDTLIDNGAHENCTNPTEEEESILSV